MQFAVLLFCAHVQTLKLWYWTKSIQTSISIHVVNSLDKEITNVRQQHLLLLLTCVVTYSMSSTEEIGTGGNNPMLLHTQNRKSHAALQLQEITSVLMTQVSGESSASSIDLRHTVDSVTA